MVLPTGRDLHRTAFTLGLLAASITPPACAAVETTSQPASAASVAADTTAVTAARALIARVLPGHAGDFVCEIIPQDAGRDVFEITSRDGKIVLRGNNGVSLATAFNQYLHREAKTGYDWQTRGPLVIEGALPRPTGVTRQVCLARDRFFLNYCTYGYTFPFTRPDAWERFIDWMAMNGINRPLMQCGQEIVWLKVWESYGIPRETILAYFSGPAHLPWHRMTNLDGFDGPLPMSYVEGQYAMQKKLLGQARALGMTPILSGFAGHVPEALKAKIPGAKIAMLHPGWGGLGKKEACWFLDPKDPAFGEIQKKFLGAQTALYGTDHRYAADPFNEITPPSWEPAYMAGVAKSIFDGMNAADPKAVWYQMTWAFYFDKHWSKKSPDGMTPLRALCEGVPKGRMVLIDYVCEETEFHKQTEGFYGAPFLWNYIGNYGGNTYFRAPMNLVAGRLAKALPIENCLGVGAAPEGLDCNPAMFEMLFEQPWRKDGAIDDASWISEYAVRRAGRDDPQVRKAWDILLNQVFNPGPKGHHDRGSALTAAPEKKGPPAPKTALVAEIHARDPKLMQGLVAALDALFAAAPESRQADGYRYDVVNCTRQALAWYSDTVKARLDDAVKRADKEEAARQTRTMLGILRDMDELAGTRHEFLLGPWIRDARAWAATPAEADYYEANARRIITAWGGGLRDYARREWNGLLRDYYLPRWQNWAKKNSPEALDGTPVGASGDFINAHADYATEPAGDPVEVAQRIFQKYRAELAR